MRVLSPDGEGTQKGGNNRRRRDRRSAAAKSRKVAANSKSAGIGSESDQRKSLTDEAKSRGEPRKSRRELADVLDLPRAVEREEAAGLTVAACVGRERDVAGDGEGAGERVLRRAGLAESVEEHDRRERTGSVRHVQRVGERDAVARGQRRVRFRDRERTGRPEQSDGSGADECPPHPTEGSRVAAALQSYRLFCGGIGLGVWQAHGVQHGEQVRPIRGLGEVHQ